MADGELPGTRVSEVTAHLTECWFCRARKQEIESAALDFIRAHRANLDPLLPPPAGGRALLKARLAQAVASGERPRLWPSIRAWAYSGAGLLLILAGASLLNRWRIVPEWMTGMHPVPVSFPEPSLTPGAVATVNKDQICATARPKNRAVPASLRRRVFEEYGIPAAEPRAYEVDYLITPALGGADDIRNLWPQSSTSAVWNAQVKDALEDRLHELVCEGDLDLPTAQREIASDWIAAYKKYFRTDRPVSFAR